MVLGFGAGVVFVLGLGVGRAGQPEVTSFDVIRAKAIVLSDDSGKSTVIGPGVLQLDDRTDAIEKVHYATPEGSFVHWRTDGKMIGGTRYTMLGERRVPP